MEKIKAISLSKLPNDLHLQYMTEFRSRSVTIGVGELGIANQFPPFDTAVTAEGVAMRVEQGSAFSPEVERVDMLRDNTLYAIYKRVDSAVHSPIAAEVASGVALQRIIDKYGDVRNWELNAESNSINLLLADLQLAANTTHLQNVGIATWVPQLKAQNDQFITLYGKRNLELANRTSGNTKAARQTVDNTYRVLVDTINATVQLNMAKPAALAFVKEWNELLLRYKTIIAQHQASLSKAAEKADKNADAGK